TRDHTVAASEQERLGLSHTRAGDLPGRNQVTRDLGGRHREGEAWIDRLEVRLEHGALLLLCSDGLPTAVGADELIQRLRASASAISTTEVRTVAEIQAHAQRACLFFAAGIAALILGRLVSARRGVVNIPSPLIMPATCAALAIGFALQMGYGDPLHRTLWPGPEFAKGVGLAGGAAAVILMLPLDPVALTGPV